MKTVETYERTKKLSSQYNPNLIYIPRSQRPEWNLIALLGQVPIKKDQRINPKWIKLKSEELVDYYLIR
jgi:hypothetical protein